MNGSRRWPWLVLAAFLVHNLEEHLRMEAFLAARREALPAFARRMMGELTLAQFDLSLALVTALMLVVTLLALRARPHGAAMNLMLGTGVGAGLLLNALQHTASSVFLGALSPGAITGWLVLIPVGVAVTVRAFNEKWITVREYLAFAALGALAMAGLPALHALSGMVLRSASGG